MRLEITTLNPPSTFDWQLEVLPGRFRFLCVDSSSLINKVVTVDNNVMMGDMIVVRSSVVVVYGASRMETPLQNWQYRHSVDHTKDP